MLADPNLKLEGQAGQCVLGRTGGRVGRMKKAIQDCAIPKDRELWPRERVSEGCVSTQEGGASCWVRFSDRKSEDFREAGRGRAAPGRPTVTTEHPGAGHSTLCDVRHQVLGPRERSKKGSTGLDLCPRSGSVNQLNVKIKK